MNATLSKGSSWIASRSLSSGGASRRPGGSQWWGGRPPTASMCQTG